MFVLKCWPLSSSSSSLPSQNSSSVVGCLYDLVVEFDDRFPAFKGQFVFKQRSPKQLAQEFGKK